MNSAEHYTTRYLETDDLDQYNALLRYTFQVTEEELTATGWKDDEIKQSKFPVLERADVLGCFDGDTLVSQFAVYPLKMNIYDEVYHVGFVTSVCTYPEYTGQGIMKKLMIQGLTRMYEEGKTFALLYPYSIPLVGMGTAAVLIYLMPSLVMLFSVVFLHEKFTPGKGLCLVLSLLGCALVSGVAGGVTLDAGGVAYGLGAALCYTLQNILLATKLKKYSPMTNLFYMFLFSAAASLVFTAAAGELPGVAYILTTPGALAANLGLGLVCSLAAQWLYTAALKTIPASRASIAATFEPVAAALFGLVLFGQKMDGFGVAGIVCEIAALVLLQLPAPAKRKG